MLPKRRSGSSVLTDLEVRAPGRDLLAFSIPCLIALGVYIFSLPPSITLEDAGELVVAADHLGVPHPPGYPLWTLLAWFFQAVFGFVEYRGYPNPAWPIALMSAVFGSLACGLLSVCTARLIRSFCACKPTPRPSLQHPLPVMGTGAVLAITLCVLLQRQPALGGGYGKLLSTLFLLTTLLQGLGPKSFLQPVRRFFPSLADLGSGFWGFILGLICYVTVWSRTLIPSLGVVVPLSLIAVTLLLGLSTGLRAGFQKAFQKPNLQTDIARSYLDVVLGTTSGLLLAFTPLMYSQSVIVEVYSLNAFFIALLLLLVLNYIQNPTRKKIYLIGFLFALGLTNHQSLLFLVFFLIAGVAAANQKRLLKDGLFLIGLGALGFALLKAHQYHGLNDVSATRWFLLLGGWVLILLAGVACTQGGLFTTWRTLVGLVALGILGLSLHLYMPIASSQNPPMNWGNTQTWEGFRHSLTRGQYARFSVGDNVKKIGETLSTPVPLDSSPEEIQNANHQRTLFIRMLGAYLFNPDWKTSIASQFSLQIPTEDPDPSGTTPPPPERTIPLALLGVIPLLVFGSFPPKLRGWFISSVIAMFFLTVVFLTIQWPELHLHDLWVKRVQYVQAHVLFACWMGLGAGLLLVLGYGFFPKRGFLICTSLPLCALLIGFPLWREAQDPKHIEHLGASSHRGDSFGWQFGFFQLRGANGILLEELAHQDNPPASLNSWAITYLKQQKIWTPEMGQLSEALGSTPLPLSEFRKSVFSIFRGSEDQRRWIEEAALLGAFRSMTPEEQEASLVHLPRPLPDWDYPAEMTPNAILFGGTDPGRFVPTYMVFSARVRPDIFVLTQTALADTTYQQVTRNFYGDQIALPDFLDANQAFLDYTDELRLFYPSLYAQVMGTGNTMAVSGVSEVNRINAILTRQIVERNAHAHDFYFEQAIRMPWMTQHLRPHGFLFKLEAEPTDLDPSELRKNQDFWDWMEEYLLETEGKRNLYQRNLTVRKTFSKLRMSQAWNFHARNLHTEAHLAMSQALRFYPANPEATFRASDLYMQQGDFEKAEELLRRFRAHEPQHPQLPRLTQTVETRKHLDEQRVLLEKNLALRPTGNTALQLLQIYSSLGRYERANEMAELVLRLPNLHSDFYPNLARLMQRNENLELYKKAIITWTEQAPDSPEAWIDLAVIHLHEEDYTSMMSNLVRAVQLDPEKARTQIAQDPRFIDIRHWKQFQRLVR